jgi:hypothetical protein
MAQWVGLFSAAFLLGFLVGRYRVAGNEGSNFGTLIGAAVTLIATFAGAYYAFHLHENRERRREIEKQVEAGNKTIFELIRTYNQFLTLRRQFIDSHRNSPGRHFFIMPVAGTMTKLALPFDELTFLFNSDNPNILGRLASFQQEVTVTIDVIEQRSAMHFEQVQSTLERVTNDPRDEIRVETLEKELGPRLATTIKGLTDSMVEGIDGAIAGCESYIDDLSELLKAKFPSHTILGMLPYKEDQTNSNDSN